MREGNLIGQKAERWTVNSRGFQFDSMVVNLVVR